MCPCAILCPHLRSTWVPLGDYIASNTDECTATLMYAVSFEYIYPDSSIVFEFFVSTGWGSQGCQGGDPVLMLSPSP